MNVLRETWCVAQFIHTTACPVNGLEDPQLHAYVFVFNMTWDEQERRWKAGKFRELIRDAPYFQAAFRVRLANKLQDMGFEIERRGGDFEVAGIPAEVLRRFSRRTEVVEKGGARARYHQPEVETGSLAARHGKRLENRAP